MSTLRIAFDSSDAARNAKIAQESLRSLGAEARRTESELQRISDVDLELGNLRLDLGPDPLGVRSAVASATQALGELEAAKRRVSFGAGVFGPESFGAGLGGSFSAVELGLAGVTAAEERATAGAASLATNLGLVGSASVAPATASVQQLAASTIGASDRMRELFSLQRSAPTVATSLSGATSLGGTTTIDPRGAEIIRAQEAAYAGARSAAQSYGSQVVTQSAAASGALDLHLRSILRLGGAFLGFQGVRAVGSDLVGVEAAVVQLGQSTGITGDRLDALADKIIAFSASGIPVATQELIKFGEAAGRLQIRTPEGVEQFVRDVGQLRTIGPEIGGSADEAGNAIGRFLGLVGEAPSRVQPLSDAIARLDDEFSVSGKVIFETAEQVARTGGSFIRSSADALGLGAAMAKVNIEGGRAGQVIAQFGVTVRDAVSEGGAKLQTLADLTGIAKEKIDAAFRADAASLFIAMLAGLERQGGETARALDDLSLASVRQAGVLPALIAHNRDLARGVDEAREAQARGTDAARDAAEIQDTLGARLTQTRNIITAAVGANQGLASSFSSVVSFGNQVAAAFLGVSDEAFEVSRGAQAVATGLQTAAVATGGALIVTKLAAGYTSLTGALAVTTVGVDLYTGAATTATVVTTGLSAAVARFGAFLATPLGAGLALGGVVVAFEALDNALTTAAPTVRGIAADFRELDDSATEVPGKIRDINAAFADLQGEASQFSLGKALQLRGVETGNVEDQKRGLEQQIRAVEGAALRLRALELEGGGFVDIGQIQSITKGSIAPDIDVTGAARQVKDGLFDEFSALASDGKLRTGLQEALQRVASGLEFRPKPGVNLQDLAKEVQREIDVSGISDTTVPLQVGDESLGRAYDLMNLLGDSIEVARVRAGPFIEDLEAIGSAKAINVQRIKPPELDKQVGPRPSDFFTEESRRIKEAIREAELSAGKFTVQRGVVAPTSGSVPTPADAPESGTVVRGHEARRAALIAERQAYDELIESKLRADGTERISKDEAQTLRSERDELLAVALASEELAEAQRVLGVESDQLTRSSSILGKELENISLKAGRETAQSFALMREQIELAHQADEKRIQGREADGVPAGEIAADRRQSDAQKAVALAGVNLRESLFGASEQTRKLQEEQAFLSKSSEQLERRLSVLADIGRGETADAFELMRQQIVLAREEAEKGFQRQELEPSANPAHIEQMRRFADETQEAELRALGLRKAINDVADSSRQLQFDQGLLTRASGLLSIQLQILGDRAEGRTARAYEVLRQQIELTHAAAESDIRVKQLSPAGATADEVQKLRDMAQAERDLAIEALETRRVLNEQARSISELGNGAATFGGAITDALLGIRDPAEAAKAALLDVARSLIQPRITAALLAPFGNKGKQAAEQVGVRDLLPDGKDATDSKAEIASAAGIDRVATSSAAAAIALDRLTAAAASASAPVGFDAVDAAVGGLDLPADAGARVASDAAAVLPGAASGAAAEAATQVTATAAAGEVASASLTRTGVTGELAAAGLTQANAAALQVVFGFQAALRAALAFAGEVGASAAASTIGGAVGSAAGGAPAVPQALGGVVTYALGGVAAAPVTYASPGVVALALGGTPTRGLDSMHVVALSHGGVPAEPLVTEMATGAIASATSGRSGGGGGGASFPSVRDLSGRVVSRPTYALIGEGLDRELVAPLDARGGMRAIGPRGQILSLPLARDPEGKLAVRVDREAVRRLRLDEPEAGARGSRPGEQIDARRPLRQRVDALDIGGTAGVTTRGRVQALALGGVPGDLTRSVRTRVEPLELGGVPDVTRALRTRVEPSYSGAAPDVQRLALVDVGARPSSREAFADRPGDPSTRRQPSLLDQRRSELTINYTANTIVQGGGSPVDTGQRHSARQAMQELMTMLSRTRR